MTRRKILGLAVGIVLALCLVSVVISEVSYFLSPARVNTPIVMIDVPRSGEKLAIGHAADVQAVARDSNEVTRIELWVDGRLERAQSSTRPGGISSLPLMASWRPSLPGSHNLTVRAFNVRGGRGMASIVVEAIPNADRDGDTTPDAVDACPDQPGMPATQGCAVATVGDGDGDGVPDPLDACLAEAGNSSADGCLDTDHDDVLNTSDSCPGQPGMAENNGCPAQGDLDSDDTPDAQDACPEEPGAVGLAGCPDRDGDSVPDRVDACPDEAGSSAQEGCPDRDSDTVRDTVDLCVDVPGVESNGGCPNSGAADSDGDGLQDDVDLSVNEAASAANGGSPPPGEGGDLNGNAIPDDVEAPQGETRLLGIIPLRGLLAVAYEGIPPPPPPKWLTIVEFQAIEFATDDVEFYSGVYCYAGLGGDSIRYPLAENDYLDRIGPRLWDISEHLGSQIVDADTEAGLQVTLHCNGVKLGAGGDRPVEIFDLGTFTITHSLLSWDGRIITMWPGREDPIEATVINASESPDSNHYFRIKYRLCLESCSTRGLPAPVLGQLNRGIGTELVYIYSGVEQEINGYKLYLNGSLLGYLPRTPSVYPVPEYIMRSCGRNLEFAVSAFRGNPFHPDAESPHSNTLEVEGVPCSHSVRITFESIHLPGDVYEDDEREEPGVVGPVYGTFWAYGGAPGSPEKTLKFDAADCSWQRCRGFRFAPDGEYRVQSILDWVGTRLSSCLNCSGFGYGYGGSFVDYVEVLLRSEEPLQVSGIIMDDDRSRRGGEPDTIFEGGRLFSEDEYLAGGHSYYMEQQGRTPSYITGSSNVTWIRVLLRFSVTEVP